MHNYSLDVKTDEFGVWLLLGVLHVNANVSLHKAW